MNRYRYRYWSNECASDMISHPLVTWWRYWVVWCDSMCLDSVLVLQSLPTDSTVLTFAWSHSKHNAVRPATGSNTGLLQRKNSHTQDNSLFPFFNFLMYWGTFGGGLPRTAGALHAQAGQATDTVGTGGTHNNTVVILVTGVITGHASGSNKTNIQQ